METGLRLNCDQQVGAFFLLLVTSSNMASTTRSKKAKQIKQLHAKRTSILGSAQLICDFADNYSESQAAELPFRLQRLDKLWEDYEKVETELDSLLNGEPQFSEDHAEFQNKYFRLKGILSSKMSTPILPPGPTQSTQSIFQGMRLPELKLPEFDGNPAEWSGFHDLFMSMIHDNTSLSNIQKLHYLRASLKGDAARIIHSLPIASTSYGVAWKLVTDRYENKYFLVKQHIAALFSIPPLRKESPTGLSELADEFEKHVNLWIPSKQRLNTGNRCWWSSSLAEWTLQPKNCGKFSEINTRVFHIVD